MITAKNGDNTISRNSSFFKKLRLTVPEDESDTIDAPSVIEHPQKYPNHSEANVPAGTAEQGGPGPPNNFPVID